MNRAGLLFVFALLSLVACRAAPEGRQSIGLSGPGWHLWYDKEASWKDDPLFLPPVDLSKVPSNAPTEGWDALEKVAATAVAVPGTVEEYLQATPGPAGDLTGVSWWWRTVQIPAATSPRHLVLRFDAVRMRAEIFVNRRLVGYDLVGSSPFEVDISDAAKPGDTIQLAVRVTDPGGNFDWRDGATISWGKHGVLGGHGFGGIPGDVGLLSRDPVHISDIYLGAWHAHLETAPQRLGTTVGVIEYGRGRIIVSTLDIAENLLSPETPAHVARKLLSNYLEFARGGNLERVPLRP